MCPCTHTRMGVGPNTNTIYAGVVFLFFKQIISNCTNNINVERNN